MISSMGLPGNPPRALCRHEHCLDGVEAAAAAISDVNGANGQTLRYASLRLCVTNWRDCFVDCFYCVAAREIVIVIFMRQLATLPD